jgi:hypothetical protein
MTEIAESKAAAVAKVRAERAGLEVLAMHVENWYDEDEGPTEAEIEQSKAISLKRIADALTEGTAQHYGVVRSLHNIEYNTRAAGGV